MPRKGYVRHKPKNLVRVDGDALCFVSINRNGYHDIGETPESREFKLLMDTFEHMYNVLKGLKHYYLAVDLDVLPKPV